MKLRPAEWLVVGFVLPAIIILFILRPELLPFTRYKTFPWTELLTLLAASLALKAWRLKRLGQPVKIGSDLRTAMPMIATIFCYPLIPALIMAFGREDQDSMLYDWDLTLFGDVTQKMQSWISLPASTWMAVCYSAYGFLVVTLFAWFCTKNENSALDEFVFEMTLALTIGYSCYILMPAIGPMFTQTYSVPIELPPVLGEIKAELMDKTRIPRDCFPSLHTAISLLCWFQIHEHFRKLSWWLAPVIFTIPIACIYLRYHYAVDVLAGLALAFVVRFIAKL